MTQSNLEALLGRPLTPVEVTNRQLYLTMADDTLESMLCTKVCNNNDSEVYDSRIGYSTVFTNIFSEVTEVKVDGEVVDADDYTVKQWDKRNGEWFNSIVFKKRFTKQVEVEVTADFGFSSMPVDLLQLKAELFGQISSKNSYDPTVSSKKVEDFTISFNSNVDLDQDIKVKYASIINKYSMCNIGYMRHESNGCI